MSAQTRRLPVRFDEGAWSYSTGQLSRATRDIATGARSDAERNGVALADTRPCATQGGDGTELRGCVKVYIPINDKPASDRPYGFVLQLLHDEGGFYWAFVAFGPRHPRPGVRSVYERAHKQLHGRFPSSRRR